MAVTKYLYECPSCNKYIETTPPPTRTENTSLAYTYHKCECGAQIQVNHYKTLKISDNLINTNMLAKSVIITESDLEIDLEKVQLENTTCITDQLSYFNEMYELGDDYCILDLLYNYKLADIEDYPNHFELYNITYNNIHLGIIGTEIYKKDPKNVWVSWTFVLPTFRSKGIGNAAFKSLAKKMKELGFTNVYVDCESVEQNPKTIRFYEKLGFTRVSTAKEFRKMHKEYNKDFLMYDQDIIMELNLENYKG